MQDSFELTVTFRRGTSYNAKLQTIGKLALQLVRLEVVQHSPSVVSFKRTTTTTIDNVGSGSAGPDTGRIGNDLDQNADVESHSFKSC